MLRPAYTGKKRGARSYVHLQVTQPELLHISSFGLHINKIQKRLFINVELKANVKSLWLSQQLLTFQSRLCERAAT